VTAVRDRGGRGVEVELDGSAWRVVPLSCAVAARLAVGVPLDRERAVTLNRSLREHRALTIAARTLRHADHSRATLEQRLAGRGVDEGARGAVLARLERAGAVDDRRLAGSRAAALARRGLGDAAIRDDLERRGIDPVLVEEALAGVEPEAIRARELVRERGATPRTARLLTARGFGEDAVGDAIAGWAAEG
jgi:regulatory protein